MTRLGLALLALAGLTIPRVALAQTLPAAQQITSSTDGISENWSNRTSSTSGGKILFAGSDDTVYLYDGATVQSVQPTNGQAINSTVMMLGSGSSAGSVIAGWRRGAGSGWVSIDGGTPHQVNLNPEHLSVRSGCVFMTLQTAADGNQAFQIDPTSGTMTQIGTDPATANHGAFRVISDGCAKVAYGWLNASNLYDLHYWNGGSTATTVATSIVDYSSFSFAGGRIVYTRVASGGIQQVFLIDTNVSLTPVQLSSETDSTKVLSRPQTDGRHVAWYRANADGSNAQLVLNGGIVFPTGTLGKLSNNEFPFQLNRGQLLWANAAEGSPRTIFYDDGMQTFPINPSPATNILLPWLTDGTIAFLGPTPTGGTDNDVFRVTGTTPTDASQPPAPLTVEATAGTGQVSVDWDHVLGTTSYNLYLAQAPGVTKDNYTSLAGGRKIAGVTPPYAVTGLVPNTRYYFAVSSVDATGEGPSSRNASVTFVGNLTWQSVGGLSATAFYSVAADQSNGSLAYAGANGSVYKSSDGGINWTQTLSHATTGGTRIAALAVAGAQIFANAMTQADIWQSTNSGVNWTEILAVSGFGELNGALAIDPTNSNTIYAGDFILPSKTLSNSLVIKSINGGANWALTPEGPGLGDEIHAYAIAVDPNNPSTLYAGGTGTPNLAKTTNGAASWTDMPISGNTGGVYSIAVDPRNSSIVYASTRDVGVYKSMDGGSTWIAKNTGLTVAAFTGYNSILVDPQDSNYILLGAGNGYWYSTDGAESWTAANNGFGGSPPYIYALTLTPGRRLIAATSTGLYLSSLAPPPSVTGISPNTDNIAGGTAVTITGSGFQSSATVTLGGTSATGVSVVSATTITATTPAHSAGTFNVVVTNFDGQSGTLAAGFTYTATPLAPTNVTATAQTSTSILVSWNASSTATSYQVFRRDAGTSFVQVGTPTGTTFPDTVTAATSHLYRVRAVNGSGASADSAQDIATTVIFTDDPLSAGVVVKAVHLAELRTAVNAVRQLDNLIALTFTDNATPGTPIKAVHISDLRTALDAALGPLGFSTGGYTGTTLTGVTVKAVHFQEIRDRVK